MAYSYTQYTVASSNDTTTTYATPPYRSGKAATDISVAVDGVTKTAGVDYTISGTSVTFTSSGAPLATSVVRIARNTSQNAAPSDYSENTILTSAQLNATQEQLFFMAQEAIDTASETNLAGLTFYSSSTSAPTSPALGDLWYDTFNKYLKIYNGTEWELATPNNESFTYTTFTAEAGTYSYVTVANINTEALVFLNGVKQVRDTVKANLLASSGAKDYFIDTVNSRVYFKTLGADSVVEVILAASNLGTANSTKIETFTATAGQTAFNLSNTYLQNTNSVNIFVNGVRQSAFTETDNNTVTLTNGASVGDEVVVIINLYDTVQGSIDSVNVTHTPAGTGAVATTVKAKLDKMSVTPQDFGAVGDGVADDTTAIQAAIDSGNNVQIPKGTYKISSTIKLVNDYQKLEGSGKNTVLENSTTSARLFQIGDTGNSGVAGQFCSLSNITLKGNSNTTEGLAILSIVDDSIARAARDVSLTDVRIQDVGAGYGLRVSAWELSTIALTIFDCNKGILLGSEANSCNFTNTYVTGCTNEAVDLPNRSSAPSNIVFTGLTAQYSGGSTATVHIDDGNVILFDGLYLEANTATNNVYVSTNAKGVTFNNVMHNLVSPTGTASRVITANAVKNFTVNGVTNIGGAVESLVRIEGALPLSNIESLFVANGSVSVGLLDDQSTRKATTFIDGLDTKLVSTTITTLTSNPFLTFSDSASSASCQLNSGTGSPEGAVTANVGSIFLRTDGGANTTLYVKESGTGNTGWAAK